MFWKKVQRQKHPGRWGIVEHQIPSIKVLFETSAKSQKHPGIKLISSESKTQLVHQRKQNSYRRAHTRTHMYVYIYIYIYIYRASGREQRSSGGNTSSNPQVSAPFHRPVVFGMERMCQRHGGNQTPTLLFQSKNHVSFNSYSITYAVEEFLLSIVPNSVTVWSLQ